MLLIVGQLLASSTELDEVLRHVAGEGTALLRADGCSVSLYDPETETLTLKAAEGFEAKVTGEFPWTCGLPERYRCDYGDEFIPLLPHLRYDLGRESPIVRHRYRRLVGKLLRSAFVKPIHDWCRRYGKESTGHFSPEENPLGQQAMVPDLMELLKDMQLPGVDLISSNIGTILCETTGKSST